jgi:HYR domain
VNYSATSTDAVSGSPAVSCSPPSGTGFHLGTTTVNCSATDGAGNTAHGSFTVTITDNSPPTFSGTPGDRQVEANGPGGSIVTYTKPTATDTVEGPIATVNCAPASGSLFPLGTTTVTCSASDSHGNVGHASFNIRVADTTPPTLSVPGPTTVYATTPTGIPETEQGIQSFRAAAFASDIVDPHPVIGDDLGSFAEVGVHTVNFRARDASGNAQVKSTTLTVLPEPPAGTAQIPPPPSAKPPADPPKLQIFPGDGAVRLVWGAVAGAAQYVVYRSENAARRLAAGGHGQAVYTGKATTYTDRGLTNGVEYRYVVVAEDAAGNQSAGVAAAAVPRRDLLRAPKDGVSLRKPPKLVWLRNSEASYYNVQVFRGQTKILSKWPVGAALVLQRSWKFEGKRYKLTPGVYQWYVWPGFGSRSAIDYGELLGFRTFRIVR